MRHYKFDLEPVSVNRAYIRNRNRTQHIAPWSTEFKESVKSLMEERDSQLELEKFSSENFDFIYVFHIPRKDLYLKDGSRLRSRHDVTNFFKILEDAIMDYLDTNDAYVINVSGHKRESVDEEWHIDVLLGEGGELFSSMSDIMTELNLSSTL